MERESQEVKEHNRARENQRQRQRQREREREKEMKKEKRPPSIGVQESFADEQKNCNLQIPSLPANFVFH